MSADRQGGLTAAANGADTYGRRLKRSLKLTFAGVSGSFHRHVLGRLVAAAQSNRLRNQLAINYEAPLFLGTRSTGIGTHCHWQEFAEPSYKVAKAPGGNGARREIEGRI